jgi:multisubunit Na+/H+ antiporter MnhB subunit
LIRRVHEWVLMLAAFGVLAWALTSLPEAPRGLVDEALESLHRSGVSNPVTAVLLNYRSYDTLLEVGVLLLSVVAVWSLRREPLSTFAPRHSDFLLSASLRFLLPLLVLTAGYLLWLGAFAPGGAFQGGALIGGAIVLASLGGSRGRWLADHRGLLRTGLWFGLAIFIGVGLAAMLPHGQLLEYPRGQAGTWILVIEAAALISIGLTLGCLFYGGRPVSGEDFPRGGDR